MAQLSQQQDWSLPYRNWRARDLAVVLLCKSGRFQTHLVPTTDALMLAESWSDSK